MNKFLNQLLGGIAGALQIIFFTSIFLLLLNVFDIPNQKNKDGSLLYSSIYSVTPSIIDLIVGSNFKTEGFIKDYINSQNDEEVPAEFTSPIDLDTLNTNNDK